MIERIFEQNQIKNFEIRILSEGQCQAFLPMSFIEKGYNLFVTYHTEEYIPLISLDLNQPYDLLHRIEMLLICIKDAENYLIPFERYMILKEEIFFSEKWEYIRLKFEPESEQVLEDFSTKFSKLMNQIKILVLDERTKEYLEMVIKKLENTNISREGITNYIGELKREVHICGW